ncbi:MAG TPA: DALR anticodon-binding domain-containing protein, partial [Acidobacteriota bacterium]|nr:DALR anticodon-binding domain-containing protein [Acidobacteriota bacterium]
GYEKQAENSIHFAYEMVALSPKTAQTLGLSLTEEDQKRSWVEMSGRKGLGVKADELMDHLEKTLVERIASQYSDLSTDELHKLAATIASAALRYFMVRYARNTLITFDIDEASSFEGETGPYLQYSAVRARSILRKLTDFGFDLAANREALNTALHGLAQKDQEADDSWSILYQIAQTHDIVEKAIVTLEVSFFARHAFDLARAFNNYYHKYPILQESVEQRKLQRIAVVQMFVTGFETILGLLGISVPARM